MRVGAVHPNAPDTPPAAPSLQPDTVVLVGVSVGVAVNLGVFVGVRVGVGVAVAPDTDVFVGVGVGVAVPVAVDVPVRVGVGVRVGSDTAALLRSFSVTSTEYPERSGLRRESKSNSWSRLLRASHLSFEYLTRLGLLKVREPSCRLMNSEGFRHLSSWNSTSFVWSSHFRWFILYVVPLRSKLSSPMLPKIFFW